MVEQFLDKNCSTIVWHLFSRRLYMPFIYIYIYTIHRSIQYTSVCQACHKSICVHLSFWKSMNTYVYIYNYTYIYIFLFRWSDYIINTGPSWNQLKNDTGPPSSFQREGAPCFQTLEVWTGSGTWPPIQQLGSSLISLEKPTLQGNGWNLPTGNGWNHRNKNNDESRHGWSGGWIFTKELYKICFPQENFGA